MLLAGDIGGTKTHLAVFSPEKGPHEVVVERVYPSSQYQNLEAIVQAFTGEVNLPIERAVFGVAGPVTGAQATITNLPWIIRASRLQEVLQIASVTLLNDLEAIAYSVPFLAPDELHTLNDGDPEPYGPIAVIAPGTGLGEAYLTAHNTHYHAHPSEGGHADFAPTDELEMSLLRYMLRLYDHVSYEKVCSGLGIRNLYFFLKNTGYAPEPPWLAKQLLEGSDATPLIVNAALKHEEQPCELAVAALRLFVSILGARHPAAHSALAGAQILHAVLPQQGTLLHGADPLPSARDPASQRGADGRCLLWPGVMKAPYCQQPQRCDRLDKEHR